VAGTVVAVSRVTDAGIAVGTEGLVSAASVLDLEVSEVAAIFELEGTAGVLIDVFGYKEVIYC